jgi:uncharacterized protein involved in exopolysaccharide biosynthesis
MEFLKLREILLGRKWIIISIFLFFFISVGIAANLVTPTYEARAKLLLETSDTLSSLMPSLGLEDTGPQLVTAGDDYETDSLTGSL